MAALENHHPRRPVLIAGASSGIGAATACELAARGFPVALAARRLDRCRELAEKIRNDGCEAIAVRLDVTDADSVARCVSETVDSLGEIEVLVTGAGDVAFGRLQDLGSDAFQSQLEIHLLGANRLATEVLPGMLARKRGQLIFVGSTAGLRQRPHMGAYGAAKAGLIAMVANLQMELEGSGVTASVVHPGPTRTSMGSDVSPDVAGPMVEDLIKWGFGRHGGHLSAADLARAIAFVAETPRGGHVVSMTLEPDAPLAP